MVEIKSFAVIDGQADGDKVAAAAIQSAVYVLALRQLLAELGTGPEAVSDEDDPGLPGELLQPAGRHAAGCAQAAHRAAPPAFPPRPDRRRCIGLLPPGLTFDLELDQAGLPHRPAAELADDVRTVPARYTPECLASCEMCFFCRDEASGQTAALGRAAAEELGAVQSVRMVLGLADGTITPADDQAEAAALLREAARLRRECLGEAA